MTYVIDKDRIVSADERVALLTVVRADIAQLTQEVANMERYEAQLGAAGHTLVQIETLMQARLTQLKADMDSLIVQMENLSWVHQPVVDADLLDALYQIRFLAAAAIDEGSFLSPTNDAPYSRAVSAIQFSPFQPDKFYLGSGQTAADDGTMGEPVDFEPEVFDEGDILRIENASGYKISPNGEVKVGVYQYYNHGDLTHAGNSWPTGWTSVANAPGVAAHNTWYATTADKLTYQHDSTTALGDVLTDVCEYMTESLSYRIEVVVDACPNPTEMLVSAGTNVYSMTITGVGTFYAIVRCLDYDATHQHLTFTPRNNGNDTELLSITSIKAYPADFIELSDSVFPHDSDYDSAAPFNGKVNQGARVKLVQRDP